MNDINKIFIQNLKEHREKLKISQAKLAEMSNLSTGFIAELEAGNRFTSIKSLKKIVDALGCKVYELFLDESDKATFTKHKILKELQDDLSKEINDNIKKIFNRYL